MVENEFVEWKCFYCGWEHPEMDNRFKEKLKTEPFLKKRHLELEIDHVIPIAKGGEDIESNKVKSCGCCNSMKGDMPPHEFIEFMATYPDCVRCWKTYGLKGGEAIHSDFLNKKSIKMFKDSLETD